ncbi:MAG: L-aspartate oxidase [Gemmatimonadota bacterium]
MRFDLLRGGARCAGVVALDHANNELLAVHARVTMLATGGIGRVYQYTTNPEIATGDGVAMADRFGAQVANMEFIQFHPTALYPLRERAFLISEAVRGEGAVLRRIDGEPLMTGIHELGSLAPRDVVAWTIALTLRDRSEPYVLLDVSSIPERRLREWFPNIVAECEARGIDVGCEPLPVVPAAHYCCCGVWTDEHARTSVPGLFAAGEVACTGVHGANRLASNSLLEAAVYSHRGAHQIEVELQSPRAPIEAADVPGITDKDEIWHDVRAELQQLMWQHAGIIRSNVGLQCAAQRLKELRLDVEKRFERGLSLDAVETRNLVCAAWLVVGSALRRKESCGLHYNVDNC